MIVQDVNDEIPEFPFLKYMVSVPENTPAESTVASVTASDRDINSQVRL